ncbi:hypothetical protein ACFQ3S_09585 [Mucilaginibacter terrae]|uniref:hypothetical protein n=1 Tax=Mucilaginibacter terrae TaxID=1955052 RepID=UPI00362ECB31
MKNIEDANQSYIESFVNKCASGHKKLFREMFEELVHTGWSYNMDFNFNRYLRHDAFVYNVLPNDKQLSAILLRYQELISTSCEICSASAKLVDIDGCWYILCKEHYVLKYPKILDIDYTGFTYNESYFFSKQNRYLWKDITEIKFLEYLDAPNNNFTDRISWAEVRFENADMVLIRCSDLNWLIFLESIPSKLVTADLEPYLINFRNNLIDCQVCEYHAVHDNKCLKCNLYVDLMNSEKKYAMENGKVFKEFDCIQEDKELLPKNWFYTLLMPLELSFKRSKIK